MDCEAQLGRHTHIPGSRLFRLLSWKLSASPRRMKGCLCFDGHGLGLSLRRPSPSGSRIELYAGWRRPLCVTATGVADYTRERLETELAAKLAFQRVTAAIFLFMIIGIWTAGIFYVYVKSQNVAFREAAESTLSAVADLKVQRIVDWRAERLGDAQAIMSNPVLAQQVKDFLAGPAESELRGGLLAWLKSEQGHTQSLRAVLLDRNMQVRLAFPEDKAYFGPIAADTAREAMRTKMASFSDLHLSRFSGEIHLDLAVPLIYPSALFESDGSAAALSDGQAVGVLDLEIDPSECLYSQLQVWPTASLTGETLLVRRDGDDVVFLNQLRHREDPALSFRLPIDRVQSLPAAMAVVGHEGQVEGVDYRDIPVLAAIRAIPGTHWFLVAKIDLVEMEAPLRERAWTVGIMLLILLVVAAMGMGLFDRHRTAQLLRRQLAAERDHAQTLEALQTERQNFEAIFASSPVGMLLLDGEAAIVNANAAMASIVSRESAEIIHQLDGGALGGIDSIEDVKDCGFAQVCSESPLMKALLRVVATGAPLRGAEIQPVLNTNDHERRPWLRVSAEPVILNGREHVVVAVDDITDRKRIEQAAYQEAELLATVLSHIPHSVFWKDRDSVYLGCNDAFARVAGVASAADIVGKTDYDLSWKKTESDWYRRCDREVMDRNEPKLDFEERQLQAGGKETFICTSKVPLRDAEGRVSGILGIYNDITERKRSDEALREANRCLKDTTARAERMAEQAKAADQAKSEFLANMSHEIRTPLTAVLGFAELLSADVLCCVVCADHPNCEKRRCGREYVDSIAANGQNLLRIISDILDLSKVEAGKLELERVPTRCCDLLAEVRSTAEARLTTKGLNFALEFEGPIPETIQTDPTRLRQVLNNVVGNAIKFTEAGGVRVVTRLIDAESPKPSLQFDVVDTGIGMTRRQVLRLFEPFAQADSSMTRRFGGTGLGLAISKRLVEILGGEIYVVETKPGSGTRFRITIDTGPLSGVAMVDDPRSAIVVRATNDGPPVRPERDERFGLSHSLRGGRPR